MKKLSFLFAILVIASATFFTSCSKDASTTPPTIMLNAGPGYTAADVSVPVNTVLKIGVIANSTTGKLTNLKISQTISGMSTTILDSTFTAKDALNEDFTITASPVAGVVKLTFRITADDSEYAEASLTITTTSAPINTYTAILLGGQLNPNLGSFYSTGDNAVMKVAIASASPAKVDFGFYYGTVNHATISAPSDEDMTLVKNFEVIANWIPRNATKMKLITTPLDWSTITDESGILANATDLTETKIPDLAVDKIVAFETASTSTNPGKKGLFKVIELNGTTIGTDREIKIEVKIQK
jgi:hypothetical protein